MDRWEGGGRCLLVQEEPYIIFAQLSKRTRPVWEKACFPGLGIGPSWWETIACLACTRALVPSPAPVWECRSVIQHSGDADKKDHKFKAIQGWPGVTRDPVSETEKRREWEGAQRESIPSKAGQQPVLSWYTGEGMHSHPNLHRASSSSSLSCSPAGHPPPPPPGSLEEARHPHQLQQLPTPAPSGELMGPVNVK